MPDHPGYTEGPGEDVSGKSLRDLGVTSAPGQPHVDLDRILPPGTTRWVLYPKGDGDA